MNEGRKEGKMGARKEGSEEERGGRVGTLFSVSGRVFQTSAPVKQKLFR